MNNDGTLRGDMEREVVRYRTSWQAMADALNAENQRANRLEEALLRVAQFCEPLAHREPEATIWKMASEPFFRETAVVPEPNNSVNGRSESVPD